MLTQETHTIEKVQLDENRTYIGNLYFGPYDDSQKSLEVLMQKLNDMEVVYEPFHTLSIYYDDPRETAPEKLSAFHGALLKGGNPDPDVLGTFDMAEGTYLKYTTYDPEMLWNAFGQTTEYAGQLGLRLAETAPLLITTFVDGQAEFGLYFPVS